tara:strand:- start:36 stop:803 length:768 start_codon:yes stop_codon:yes gene_type:complete
MAAVMLSASIGFAQTTTGDITVGTNAGLGTSGTTVKVIDNKGTIKYLQSNNGITTFTNTTPSGGVVTTWQLGGTLTTDTNITTGAQEFKISLATPEIVVTGGPNTPATQGTFIIDGVETVTGGAALTTVDGQIADASTTGYTFLVRDEATGKTKKLLASDLITGIRLEYLQGEIAGAPGTFDPNENATADVPIDVTGLPVLTAGTSAAKLSVYRNGVKLRFGVDFVVLADKVTITYDAADLPMYAGDIIEIQYLK